MGSKGSTKSTSVSQYTPNQNIADAGSTALQMSTAAAQQPFQTPVAPVAPLNDTQNQAFQYIQNAYGAAQPYFNTAAGLALQSAAPISSAQIMNYFNPFAQQSLSALNNQLGAQNSQLQGNLVQAAGGVGSDRVAVAQAEKFRQDQLARGQLMSSFYQPALSAAQADASRQGAASSLMGYFGPAAQGALLSGANAVLGAGNQQQQQTQAQLNAPYQNQLAQIAYPFQTSQFLGQQTAQLAPAFGGTQNTNTTTTPPPPNIFSQILGLGAAGLGAFMGNPAMIAGGLGSAGGGKGGGGGTPVANIGGTPQYNNAGGYWTPAPYANRGGRINPFALGGTVGPDSFGEHFAAPYDVPNSSPFEDRWSTVDDVGFGQGYFREPSTTVQGDGGQIQPNVVHTVPIGPYQETQPPPEAAPPSGAPPAMGQPPQVAGGPPPMGGGTELSMPGSDTGAPSWTRNPWLALAYAGAKMAAGTSPYFGTNLGQGVQSGIEFLGKQSNAELEAKKLYETTKHQREQLAETKRHNMMTEQHPTVAGYDPTTYLPIYTMPGPDGKPIIVNPSRTPLSGATPPANAPGSAPSNPAGTQVAENSNSVNDVSGPENSLDFRSRVYLKTGTVPGVAGSSRQAQAARQAVIDNAIKIANAEGIDTRSLPKLWQEFKAEQIGIQRFRSGPQSNTIRSFGVLADHIQTLQKLGDALDNKDYRVINAIGQAYAKQTGQPAPTNFEQALDIVGKELTKSLVNVGAGSADERDALERRLGTSASGAQIRGVINDVIKPLVGGQMEGLKYQFKTATGLSDDKFWDAISPSAREAFANKGAQQKGKPEVPADKRYKALRDSGKSKEDAVKIMREEGYQ